MGSYNIPFRDNQNEKNVQTQMGQHNQKRIEEDTGNIIVTMKGSNLQPKIDLWDNTFHIKLRPYIMLVKQCYKCFRYGHIKPWCKSEEKCTICGEAKHGNCDKAARCVNCGRDHRSTSRSCTIYERNKNIQVIMAYHNCSFRNAEKILTGRETETMQRYDRYEEPEKWRKLKPVRLKTNKVALTDKRERYEDQRKREPSE